ncbi:MAG: DNA-protecting protein DprA [Chloroflexi bacterium]|nr:DNA-protecting protein DprA [Chloroflexota bacterium]
MERRDLPYWIAFSRMPGVGPVRFGLLESYFGDLEAAWRASGAELQRAGLDSRTVQTILDQRSAVTPEAELARLEQHRTQALTWHDPGYPSRLKEVHDRPPVLYVRGSLTTQDELAVAVVGTRRATAYGREAASRLSADLARNGVTVVSGLARGIDTEAHRAALEAGGRTLAVFGCGLDVVYPPENLRLAQAILERGALLSEHPLGTRPEAGHFPRRNRIMSGISLGVLVVEGDMKSGARNTAQHALEQDREIFAVPGSVFASSSELSHWLIQQGAKLVTRVEHLLEELNLKAVAQQLEMKELLPPLGAEEELLLAQLSAEPVHIDAVRRSVGLPTATVSSTLALLELKGLVRHIGGMNYVLAR